MAVRINVCFRWNGKRGRVKGSDITCAVNAEGWLCVKHATDKVPGVVGVNAMMS